MHSGVGVGIGVGVGLGLFVGLGVGVGAGEDVGGGDGVGVTGQVPDGSVSPVRYCMELTRFRGYFPSYGERIHHGKAPYIPAGVPA